MKDEDLEQQAESLRKNTFKIKFEESKTRKTDGYALSANDYEMIAI